MEIPMIETKLCWTFWKHLFSSRFGKSWCIQVYNRSANAFQECLYPSSGHYIAPGTSFVRNWICAEKKWREPDQEYLWAFFIAKFPKSMRKNVQHVMNNQTSLYFLGLHWCHYWNSVTHKRPEALSTCKFSINFPLGPNHVSPCRCPALNCTFTLTGRNFQLPKHADSDPARHLHVRLHTCADAELAR